MVVAAAAGTRPRFLSSPGGAGVPAAWPPAIRACRGGGRPTFGVIGIWKMDYGIQAMCSRMTNFANATV